MQDGSGPGGLGTPGAVTIKLARTKYIDLHGGWGLQRPQSRGQGCLEAAARGPDAQVSPCPAQAQT